MAFSKKLTVQVVVTNKVENTITKVIKNQTTTSITPNTTTEKMQSSTPDTPQDTNGNLKSLARKVLKGTSSYAVAREAIDLTLNMTEYALDYSLKASGNYQGQLTVNRAKTIINTTTSSITKVAGAFLTGGPVVGTITAVLTGVKMGFDAFKARNEQQYKIDQQNNELSFSRVRAGYAYSDGSIGGDR